MNFQAPRKQRHPWVLHKRSRPQVVVSRQVSDTLPQEFRCIQTASPLCLAFFLSVRSPSCLLLLLLLSLSLPPFRFIATYKPLSLIFRPLIRSYSWLLYVFPLFDLRHLLSRADSWPTSWLAHHAFVRASRTSMPTDTPVLLF